MADEPNKISDRLEDIKADLATAPKENTPKPVTRWQKIKNGIKYTALGLAGAGALLTGILGYEYTTGRQDYTQRNILFRSSNTIYIAGGKEKETGIKPDKESLIEVYSGGGIESKVGTYLFETTRTTRGDIDYYNMGNSQKIRIASATQKPERFQAGLRIGGGTNFREEFAEIVTSSTTKDPLKYMVYKFSPKRGFEEIDIDVVEYPIQRGLNENEPGVIEKDNGIKVIRVMNNRLVEKRTNLGWFFGKEQYRKGTLLQDFQQTPENKVLAQEFFENLSLLNDPQTEDKKLREKIIEEIRAIQEDMDKITIYSTTEHGTLKLLPQDSLVYLGQDPSKTEKFKHWLGFGRKDQKILNVENHWDLWPGNYPILKTLPVFNKYNNGGYTIKDKFGDIARIDIRDFLLFYGQDVVYSYYLDLNGDGKIDKEKELIGEVLCTPTSDERMELKKFAKGRRPDADTTFTINYSFMAPEKDTQKPLEHFKQCAYIESMMPDQVHRGNGRHSLLLLINDQRSDILLNQELNIGNESRALTQESTLVAKYDIIKTLIAAKRPYAIDLAKQYGIESEFEGQFSTSSLLKERIRLGPWPWFAGAAGLAAGGYHFLKKRKKKKKDKAIIKTNPENIKTRLQTIRNKL